MACACGQARELRDLLTESDEWLSPQAAVLSPHATVAIAGAIVKEKADLRRTVAAGQMAVKILRNGLADERLLLSKKEQQWLDRIEATLDSIPLTASELHAIPGREYHQLFNPTAYEI